MEAYLLDTNVISDWLVETKQRHEAVSEKAEQAAREQAVLLTSAVVLEEIEYGLAAMGKVAREVLAEFRAQVDRQFVRKRLLLDVSRSTSIVYGDLRAKLFEKFGPKDRRTKKRQVDELTDPTTSKKLGIRENDLWIAAQAVERNLVLVSNDHHIRRIREVAPELRVEDWASGGS